MADRQVCRKLMQSVVFLKFAIAYAQRRMSLILLSYDSVLYATSAREFRWSVQWSYSSVES